MSERGGELIFGVDGAIRSTVIVLHWLRHWWPPRWSGGISMPTKDRSVAKFQTVEHRLTAESWSISVWGQKRCYHTNRDNLPHIPQSLTWKMWTFWVGLHQNHPGSLPMTPAWTAAPLCLDVIKDEEEGSLTECRSSGDECYDTLFQCDFLNDSPVSWPFPALRGFCSAPWSQRRLRPHGSGMLLPQQQEQQPSPSPSPSEPVWPAVPGPWPAPAQTSRETQLTEYKLKENTKNTKTKMVKTETQ